MDEQKLYAIIKALFSGILRVICSGMLGFFAFAPSYIIFFSLIKIFSGEMEIRSFSGGASLFIFLLIMLALAYFLWLLCWRALTGKSSRADGGLMPPFGMKLFSNILGIMGGGIIVYALYSGEYIKIIGGLSCMFAATMLYQKKQNV